MRTTVAVKGVTELILEKAVDTGLARSKTDALRMGVFALNREFGLIKDLEKELVAMKILKEKREMIRKGERYLSEKEALGKYR